MNGKTKLHYLFAKATQIFCCRFKSSALLYLLRGKKVNSLH